MTTPSADEVYDQFKAVLRSTVDEFDDKVMTFQLENGMADWTLNDEDHVLIEQFDKNQLAKMLCHMVILMYGAEERYLESMEEEAMAALEAVENDTESTEDEKIIATEVIEVTALAQADGFRHCSALLHGWALAAITADEGQSVDWDSIFTSGATDEEKDCE